MQGAPTAIVMLVSAVALALYDVAASLIGWRTFSELMRDWYGVNDLWVLPFAWAVLFGHFWVHPEATPPLMSLRTVLTVAILGGCVALNLTLVRSAPWWLVAPAGLALGAILWAQARVS